MTRQTKGAPGDQTPAQPEVRAGADPGAAQSVTPDQTGGAQQRETGASTPDAETASGSTAPAGATGQTEDAAGDAPASEGAPKRRRGSRGGRRHRKPAAATTAEAGDTAETAVAAPPPVTVGAAPAAPEPATTAGAEGAGDPEDEAAAPAKRRRRGSRGGRRRRKAVEAGAAEVAREAEDAAGEPGEAVAAERVEQQVAAETQPAPAGVAGDATDSGEQPPKRRSRGRGRGRGRSAAARAAEAGGAEASAATAPPGREVTPEQPAPEAAATGQQDSEAGAASEEQGRTTPRRRGRTRGAGSEARAREAAPVTGEAEAEPKAAEDAPAAAAPTGGDGDGDGGPRKRRRGSRGGRRGRAPEIEAEEADEAVVAVEEDDAPAKARPAKSRRAKAAAQVAADEADEPEEIVKRPAAEAKGDAATKTAEDTRTRRRDRRRPRAIVRQDEGSGLGEAAEPTRRPSVVAELPKRKIILVSDDGHELRVALVEDGRLAEIYIERPDKKSYLGDIYQGKVENVMTGIDAAFIDFGLEKNGFLYVDEVLAADGEKRARRIGDALKKGQQVLVQVTKDPMGSKGARLSTKISLAGRYLVYVPGGSGVGISRRLRQSERDRLRDVAKQLKPKNAGLIVRTIAEGHGLEDLQRDMRYLSRLWSRLKKKAETVKPPGLVHKEVDISVEVARDLFNDTCESLIVDDPKRHKALLAFLDKEAPELLPKVHQHTGAEPLFEAYGIEEQIARALERRVPLQSGGNLVIDHAEALTVIDVNTGRFAGGKGLEETITHTNLEAAREVVRQLRLRDIGGIIIIDFIDMARAKNREMVLATLEAELETDRTKTYVVELSPLGLVEMTRQNTTDGARGIMTRACPTCVSKARVLNDETVALMVERRVRALARKSQAKAWLIEVNPTVVDRVSGARLKRLEKETGRRVFFEGGSGLPIDAFRVISEGPVAHVQEQRIPVREGQEVEIELEFSLTYSPRDAVGYIDGYMVIVEGGRQFLGERRKVKITVTARTGANAAVLKQGSN